MKSLNIIGTLRLRIIDLLRRTNILGVLREMRVQQYFSKEKIEAIRKKKFDHIFDIATTSTEYYHQCKSYEELPVLTKDEVRANFKKLVSSKYRKKLHTKGTGGSTGTPLVYYSTALTQSFLWAGILLSWEVAGYELGDKVAFIAGSSIFKSDWKHRLFHKLLNIESYSTFALNENNIREYILRLQQSQTKIIYGYATAMDIMATYINKNGGTDFPHLKGIVSSAEVLTEANRENIEKAFGVKVYNQYGCNEAGVSAFECEHKKMHLISTRCKYETDIEGNLLSTDLANEGFIMMKYFTGDRVEFSDEEGCSCKRNFPIIKKVIGRSYDIITDVNGKILHAAFFNILFRQDESVKQFQILFDKDTIRVYLNVEDTDRDPSYYNKYLDAVKKHLYFKEYKLILNAPFLKAENAKHRYVINLTP